jgi:hypothetical protein
MDELGTWRVQAKSPDGSLKIPAVCLNRYGKSNHPLNVFFSLIGDAWLPNFKNFLFLDHLIDNGVGFISLGLSSSEDLVDSSIFPGSIFCPSLLS